MSFTSPTVPLSLDVPLTLSDTSATGGVPAASVQVQNATPFTLTVTVGGLQDVVQAWTAATLPTGGDGVGLIALPTSGPVGSQGELTCVWLLPGEGPPMADGQLTAAAQYAQGLGTTLLSPSTPQVANPVLVVPVPPNVRTVILSILQLTMGPNPITNVLAVGQTSEIPFYNQPPYLNASRIAQSNFLCFIPVVSSVDSEVSISITGGGAGQYAFTVFGDTALIEESSYYNGAAQPTQITVAGLIKDGPFRLLTAALLSAGTGAVVLFPNTTGAGGGSDLVTTSAGQSIATVAPPADYIVPLGSSVWATGAVTQAGITWAYP